MLVHVCRYGSLRALPSTYIHMQKPLPVAASGSLCSVAPDPSSAQTHLCVGRLAAPLHTPTTSRRIFHKSERRRRSVAWALEAESLVSALAVIHHNVVQLTDRWCSQSSHCFQLQPTVFFSSWDSHWKMICQNSVFNQKAGASNWDFEATWKSVTLRPSVVQLI